jgi:hypothetical protein
MLTNDLKRGMRVQLRNGWYGTIADNGRGNARMVQVEGYYTETGSCYAWDIVSYIPDPIGAIHIRTIIEHTPAQLKRLESIANGGF